MNKSSDNSQDAPAATSGPTLASEERFATVLQILPAMNSQGGVERGTVEIAAAIVDAGGRAIVASAGGPMEHDLKRVGAEHITLPLASKSPAVIWANVARLAKIIKDEKVDIVHARSRAPAWSAWIATKRTKAVFVTTFHGTYGASNWLKRWYNSIMTRGERVIAISAFIAGHVRKLYGVTAQKIRIIHRGADLNRFSPDHVSAERVVKLANDWRLTEGLPVIMLPGRLTRWKGQVVFLNAIAKLGRQDIRCLLVGSDQGRTAYRQELVNLIERHNLGGVVRIVDNCTDMPSAYMLSDIVVSASTDPEAFGRVVIEAQAMGRPVIATDHGGAKETVLVGQTGWLTKPGDVDDLAEAIKKALALDEKARKELSKIAIKNVQDNFSRETMCAKTLEVYDEVLNLRSQG